MRLRGQGKRVSEIAAYLGVHRATVSHWWRPYQQMGETALHQQPRGNKFGEGRTLSPTEEAWIQQLMREHFRQCLYFFAITEREIISRE
ncbi:helix-turn-helix domain-containing protein [Leptolyngbyaceae cyanobacterium UHCC 1019]